MRVKAKFTERQPPVRWQELGDGTVDVTICMGEKFVIEAVGDGGDYQEMFEYDFNQFRDQMKNISRQDVEFDPEKYLDYEPKKPLSTEDLEAITNNQQGQIDMLAECILEMSELVYV